MLRENAIQKLRRIVEGKAKVSDMSGILLRLSVFKFPKGCDVPVIKMVLDIVQEIVVEIVHAALFQLFLKNLRHLRFLRDGKGGQLCGQSVTVTGVTLHQSLTHHIFAASPQVNIAGIKIGEAVLNEFIHHAADFFHVDGIFAGGIEAIGTIGRYCICRIGRLHHG